MDFATLPDRRATMDPHGACLADETSAVNNTEFLGRVCAAAEALRASGVNAGETIAVRLANRIETVVLFFAAWRLNAAVTPVNPALTDAELDHQLSDSGAVLIISDCPLRTRVAQLEVTELAGIRYSDEVAPSPTAESTALIIYTSGTTGKPKGVVLTHGNIDAMAEQGRTAAEVTAGDHCLLVLPLFHVNAIVVSVLVPLLARAQTTIMKRFDAVKFVSALESTRATLFSAVPTIFVMLDALPPDVVADTSSVRLAFSGAAPGPPGLADRIRARWGFPIFEGYGLSEATCATTFNTTAQHKDGTVGRPLPGQQVRIADATGAPNPPGVDGEILIAGPTVMRGYLGRPELTAQVIRDGWLHTGDVGHLDDDGFLVIVGRLKDMIIRGGENIYPREIEDVLGLDSAVKEAAVIGRPDATFGEVVIAYVVAREGNTISRQRLDALCAQRLSPYKRPIDIRVVDDLPKNATGKVNKSALRRLAVSPGTSLQS
jgi:long-chain acyl-CoA synthetase